MQAYYGTRLSDHMIKTPEGFLIVRNCRVARVGDQEYRGAELGLDTDDIVTVNRDEAEVFHPAALASLNSKPITLLHPPQFLTSDNALAYQRGHVTNVRRGTGDEADYVLADLVITDRDLIERIRGGLRECSVGYECLWKPEEDGTYSQERIRCNHLAVVPKGRAGQGVSIMDASVATPRSGEGDSDMAKQPTYEEAMERLNRVMDYIASFSQGEVEDEMSEVNDLRANESSEFEAKAKGYHRKDYGIRGERAPLAKLPKKMQDQMAREFKEDAETFVDDVAKLRRKMLGR